MLRNIVILFCITVVGAGCTAGFDHEEIERIAGTERIDVSECLSISPDGRWLVFREYDPVRMEYSAASLDLAEGKLTRHELPEGLFLEGPGRGSRTFRYMSFQRIGWWDGRFWGIRETDNMGRPLVLDPKRSQLYFVGTAACPTPASLAALDRIHGRALEAWLHRQRLACRQGGEPAQIDDGEGLSLVEAKAGQTLDPRLADSVLSVRNTIGESRVSSMTIVHGGEGRRTARQVVMESWSSWR